MSDSFSVLELHFHFLNLITLGLYFALPYFIDLLNIGSMSMFSFNYVIISTRSLALHLLQLNLELVHHLEHFLNFLEMLLRLGGVREHFVVR